jgi:hypothetical protein
MWEELACEKKDALVLAAWTIRSENELFKNGLLMLYFSLQMTLRQEYKQRERKSSYCSFMNKKQLATTEDDQ